MTEDEVSTVILASVRPIEYSPPQSLLISGSACPVAGA